MKRIIAAALVALLFLTPFKVCDAHDFSRIMQSVAPMQEVIPVDPFDPASLPLLVNMCTATSINAEHHLWLTAAHCVELDEMAGGVRYINGDLAAVVITNKEADIAIVRTERVFSPALKMAKVGPEYGDPLKVVGHPLGMNMPILTFGFVAVPKLHVDELNRDFMLYSVVGAPGNSGSAVLNSKDEVVSILQIGFSRTFSPMTGGATWEALRKVTIGYWQS